MEFDKELEKECVHCQKEFVIQVNEADYDSWVDGKALIQDAMPYLTPGQRELLISGTCDDCWNSLFGSNDEVEDENDIEIDEEAEWEWEPEEDENDEIHNLEDDEDNDIEQVDEE